MLGMNLVRECMVCVTGVIGADDRLSSVNGTSHRLIINASDACGQRADQSTQLIINTRSTQSTAMLSRFTAAMYSFTVSRLATPRHVIGYLHLLSTGNYGRPM